MPKAPRKKATKDANGGKLGQFTTEVASTVAKAKEAQKVEFEKVLAAELEVRDALHTAELAEVFDRGFKKGLKKNAYTAAGVGAVFGSALTAILLSV